MRTITGQYEIEIQKDDMFSINSVDSHFVYKNIYFTPSDYVLPTKIGLKIFEKEELISSAIIGSIGGGTGIHDTSQIIENDKLIICCSDSVFCLSIPDLNLIWKTQADQATCFEIFKLQDSFIVHGEMEITRLDSNGNILWQNGGADIFTTEKGVDDFEITDSFIRATDWENKTYKFSFDGKQIEE